MRQQLRAPQSVAVLAAASIIAILISVSLVLYDMRERELDHAKLETLSVLQMLMQETQHSFDGVDMVVQEVQERLATPYGRKVGLNSEGTHLLLSVRASGMRLINSLFVVDDKGILVNTSLSYPSRGVSVADRDYFKSFVGGAEKSYFIDRPVRSKITGAWTVHIARALTHPDGRFRGVVVAAMSIPHFEQIYSYMKLDYSRPMALYLEDGTLVASLPHREAMIGSLAPELMNETLPGKGQETRSLRHRTRGGHAEVFAIGRLASYPLLVSVSDDEMLSLASWRESAFPIFAGALLVCLFTTATAGLLMRNLRRQEELAKALNVATNRYQHTIDSVMDAIVAVDEDFKIVLFNPAAERMFGRHAADTLGQSMDLLMPSSRRQAHQRHMNHLSASETESRTMSPQTNAMGLRNDGTEFPIESTISKSVVGGQVQYTAVLRDVTERYQAESDMRQLNTQLRHLYAGMQHVREEERTRISRELHDELGQQLIGLKLSLSWLGNRIKEGRTASVETVDEMRQLLDTATASVRRISTELRPPVLDDLGFGDALAWLAREVEKHSAFKVELHLAGAALVVGPDLPTALFRIVQESLTNVARHAQASKVVISLHLNGDDLLLRIADNGRGFAADAKRDGIGLVSMRERALSVGARFCILSQPDSGTAVEVTIPMQEHEAQGEQA